MKKGFPLSSTSVSPLGRWKVLQGSVPSFTLLPGITYLQQTAVVFYQRKQTPARLKEQEQNPTGLFSDKKMVNFLLQFHKIVEPTTKTMPVMGKVLMLFSLQVKDLPQQMQVQALSHLPVAGWHGVVWHGVAWGRQGQIRKVAHGWMCAQVLSRACKSQLWKSKPCQSPHSSWCSTTRMKIPSPSCQQSYTQQIISLFAGYIFLSG